MKQPTRKASVTTDASDLLDAAYASSSEQRSNAPKETTEHTDEEPVQRIRRKVRLKPTLPPLNWLDELDKHNPL